MDDLELTEYQANCLPGYQELALRWRIARTPEEAHRAALLWCVLDFGTVAQLEKVLVGANPNVVYPRGSTPLGLAFRAFRNDTLKAVRLLLEAGADPYIPSERETPLTLACQKGPPELVSLVLDALQKIRKPAPNDLLAPLLHVASRGDLSSMKQLLNCGAPVNQQGLPHQGLFHMFHMPDSRARPVSALMVAAAYCRPQAVKALLEAGADVNLKDGEGHTALDYALFDPKAGRKAAALLQQAGGVSAKPFPPPADEPTRGFAAAARKPAFKNAVERIKQLTGLKPGPLEGADDTIPGGKGFLLDDDSAKTFVEAGPAAYLNIRDRARQFVEQHHAEMLAHGAWLFHTRDLMKRNGTAIALLPTTDVYKVIAAVEMEGADDDVIAWLRSLEKDQPFLITGVGSDFIEGRFTTPIQDPAALVKRINEICPGDNTSPAAEQRAIQLLSETKRLFLWWD